MVLPEEYKEHMKELLGGEYESFISIYDDDRERSYGLRKNLLKYNSDDFDKIIGLKLEKVSWASEGYYYDPAERPGKNALHEAGAYYIQEPSAMCLCLIRSRVNLYVTFARHLEARVPR